MSPLALSRLEDGGITIIEGRPGAAVMAGPRDGARVLEACFTARSRAALLYAENLPPAFFDLSSGEAGVILQQFRNYGVRLAVVVCPESAHADGRFGELVDELAAEERGRSYFGVFGSREEARAWLREPARGARGR